MSQLFEPQTIEETPMGHRGQGLSMKVTSEMMRVAARIYRAEYDYGVMSREGAMEKALQAVLDLITKEQDSYGVQGDRDGGDLEMQCLKGDGEGGCCAWHIEVHTPEADWVTVGRLAALAAKHTKARH